MNPWDVVVIGLGAVGSFALREASRRGAKALGLDLAMPAHARGSSHGHCRIFRHAYFEHPDYVPLLRMSTRAFEALEREQNVALLHRCGVLLLGDDRSEVVHKSLASAKTHGLAVEELAPAAIASRFPWFAGCGATRGVFESDAGLVRPERAIHAALSSALSHGSAMRTDMRAHALREERDHVVLETDGGSLCARRVIVAAGSWTAKLLPELAQRLTVTRQVQAWVEPKRGVVTHGMPCWLLDQGADAPALYGIPADPLADAGSPARAPKVAWHGSQQVVDPDVGAEPPQDTDLDPLLADYERAAAPLAGTLVDAATCLYTMSPDGDFFVGTSQQSQRICFAAGLSGHGFKLAPALGYALADLALQSRTDLPIGFLSPTRTLRA